jgi:ectoine/hydroxyectoine ABC transporter solute-binding protein
MTNYLRWAVLVFSLGLLAGCDSGSDSATSQSGGQVAQGQASSPNQPGAGQAPAPVSTQGAVTGKSTLEAVKQAGRARIGYANEAPFAYMDPATGQVTGEAVEIARAVLKKMGVEQVEGVLTEFGSLIPGLQAGRFDIIAAGMYITPERCKQVTFSNPTYGVGQAFIVQKGNPKDLHSYEDVAKHEDARLGVVVGAIEASYAEQTGIPSDRVVVFPDAASAMAGVAGGRADAYAATALTVNDLLKRSGGDKLERADPFTDPSIDGESVRGYGAFAFRTTDQDFADAFNGELANLIGSPAHRELVEPFGFTEAELPGEVTAAQLCGQ